ncbi:MAG: polysaccharide deacetylase family protein [Pseudomonadota bacterium]
MSTRNFLFKTALAGLRLSGAATLARPFFGGRGAVLMLHHVRPDVGHDFAPNKHLSVTPEFLEDTLKYIRAKRWDIVPMDEVPERLLSPKRGRRFVAITFDDGYRDNLEHAAPILRKYDAPYTIYIASGLVDGTACLWWEGLEELLRQRDRIAASTAEGTQTIECASLSEKYAAFDNIAHYMTHDLAEEEQERWLRDICWMYKIDLDALRAREIMTWSQLKQLTDDPLCSLGAHTVHHYAVARLSEDDARAQMKQSAQVLASEIGTMPKHFAYPYGYKEAAGPRDFGLAVEVGFQTAVTTRPGVLYPAHSEHLTALPRISLNGYFQKRRYFAALMSGLPTLAANRFNKVNVGA